MDLAFRLFMTAVVVFFLSVFLKPIIHDHESPIVLRFTIAVAGLASVIVMIGCILAMIWLI